MPSQEVLALTIIVVGIAMLVSSQLDFVLDIRAQGSHTCGAFSSYKLDLTIDVGRWVKREKGSVSDGYMSAFK